MNPDSSPGAVLKQLLDQHGQQLAFDADNTLRLMSQACPGSLREVEAIVAAQRQRIPWELLNMGAGADPARLDEMAQTLASTAQMPADAARWIIQTWMNALDVKVQGVTPEAQEPADLAEPAAPAATAAEPAPTAQPATAPGPARYFVVGQGGAKYGPADVPTLNQWAAEGRVSAGSVFEEEGTGRTLQAHEIAGLFVSQGAQHFPPGSYAGPGMYGQSPQQPGQGPAMRPEQPQNPYGQAPQGQYYRPAAADTNSLKNLFVSAVIFTVLGIFFNCCLGIVALIFTILGNSDMKAGNVDGARWKLIVGLVLGIVAVVVGLILLPAQIANLQRLLGHMPTH